MAYMLSKIEISTMRLLRASGYFRICDELIKIDPLELFLSINSHSSYNLHWNRPMSPLAPTQYIR